MESGTPYWATSASELIPGAGIWIKVGGPASAAEDDNLHLNFRAGAESAYGACTSLYVPF